MNVADCPNVKFNELTIHDVDIFHVTFKALKNFLKNQDQL